MEENKSHRINIDLFKLIKILLDDKKKIATYCGIGAVIGIIVAFSIPRIYKSSVMLAPESSGSSLTSNISSLAAMVGMDMKLGGNDDAIYPEIYPDLLLSTKFLVGLFDVPIVTKDQKIKTTLYDYIKTKQKDPWWDYPKILLIRLFKMLKGEKPSSSKEIDPTMLSKDDYEIAQGISHSIDCKVDKKTNVISITTTAQDALAAKIIADSVKSKLQEFITDYRTNKARHDLAYMEQLCKEAEADYRQARINYATYSDNNLKMVRESYKVKQEALENELQLRYNIYTQVIQQLQISKAKVQERTPAFTEIQPATVPVKHSNTPKIIILMLFVFLGFVIRASVLLWKKKEQILAS